MGAQSITHAISATISVKKTKLSKNYSYRDKKGSIQQQILEQKNAFLALKVTNNHVPKK
jgi:hypothetical protein